MVYNLDKVNIIKCFVTDKPIRIPIMSTDACECHYEDAKSEVIYHDDGSFTVKHRVAFERNVLPTIEYCSQCKYALDVETKLYTCDGDEEYVIYCRHHNVLCRMMRPSCDWAAVSDK